jgi:hypothetical protein
MFHPYIIYTGICIEFCRQEGIREKERDKEREKEWGQGKLGMCYFELLFQVYGKECLCYEF